MNIRKPNKNEAIAFGIGYGAGAATFPYVKKGAMYAGGYLAGLWHSVTGGEKKKPSKKRRRAA